MKPTTPSLTIIERKESINLVIQKKLLDKIEYICDVIYDNEWSGVLFYTIKGSIRNPNTLTLTATDFLPMDKGSKVHTGYDFDEDVVEYMMDNNLYGDRKQIGMIHSHNTMNVFFSGEDVSELEDNTPNHNFYLSLIVNNRMEMCARVAYRATANVENVKYISRDELGNEYVIPGEAIKKEIMYWHPVKIVRDMRKFNVTESFTGRVKTIIDKAAKRDALAKNTNVVSKNSNGSVKQLGWELTSDVEDLTIHLLSRGKARGYLTMDACIANIGKENITAIAFAKEVVEGYLNNYMKYYNILDPKGIAPVAFTQRLDGVINTLKDIAVKHYFFQQTILQLESYKSKIYESREQQS